MFSSSSPTLRIRAWTTRNLPAGAEGRRRGGGTSKHSQNNYYFYFFKKKYFFVFSGERDPPDKHESTHKNIHLQCQKYARRREKNEYQRRRWRDFFSFCLWGGVNFFVTLSDAARKYFGNFQFLTKLKKKKSMRKKKSFGFFSCQKAIRKAVLFLSWKQEQTLSKSPKNGGRFKRRNDFSTTFTIQRPGSFGKLLQNDVQVD